MKRMSVLLIDDERAILNLLQRFVEVMGHDPLLANHAEEALEILQTQKVDVVVTDLMMPVIDGWTLATRVRRTLPEVRIVGISGKVVPRAGESPFDAFVDKPFRLDTLRDAILGEQD